jgi:low affinity Fe/Cu permease
MVKGRSRRVSRPQEGMAGTLAAAVTRWAGSSWGFGLAAATVLVWAITGPIFGWSDTWQLVINTGTTIVTFLMVFLIQRTQNKDGMAIQLKLNELVAAVQGASNRLIDIEDLSEAELRTLHAHYQRLVEMSRKDAQLTSSHSIEEADGRHAGKQTSPPRKPSGPAR